MLLRLARGERTLSELARAMETSRPAAKRLEDPTHGPSLKTLDRAAAALGKRLGPTLESLRPAPHGHDRDSRKRSWEPYRSRAVGATRGRQFKG
jgi:transcriptional regulator with XRE-family HTH domain